MGLPAGAKDATKGFASTASPARRRLQIKNEGWEIPWRRQYSAMLAPLAGCAATIRRQWSIPRRRDLFVPRQCVDPSQKKKDGVHVALNADQYANGRRVRVRSRFCCIIRAMDGPCAVCVCPLP